MLGREKKGFKVLEYENKSVWQTNEQRQTDRQGKEFGLTNGQFSKRQL